MKRGDFLAFVTAVSIVVGAAIGAGVLGLPYVSSQSGFFVLLGYLIFVGIVLLVVNLYLGEIILRTNGKHQLVGYAKKYLGERGKHAMEFAVVFGIFSAIVAYLIGFGESLSFLFYNDLSHTLWLGILFGVFMSVLLWDGLKSLKKYEKIGVGLILIVFLLIIILFVPNISSENIFNFNSSNFFVPFGVVLFAMMSFSVISEARFSLTGRERLLKKVLITSIFISGIFYAFFALTVSGVYGLNTPEVATIALGRIFIFLGMLTIFTSYLALGNALIDNLKFDEKYSKFNAWFLTSLLPILVFVIIQVYNVFSFTKILSIGGIISAGLTGILILLIVPKVKKFGDRKPEYSVPHHWILTGILILIFVFGILKELFF